MKYYGVKKGKNPGVYKDWETCSKQVLGFSGAEYKSFTSLEEAKNWVKMGEDPTSQAVDISNSAVAYIDGSFNIQTGVVGYGGFVSYNGQILPFMAVCNNRDWKTMRNVAGEIQASMMAIRIVEKLGASHLLINHDYEGVAKWVTGTWQAKNNQTKEYAKFVNSPKRTIRVDFSHVKSHTGVMGNEIADILAKKAAGIYLSGKEYKLYCEFINYVTSLQSENIVQYV